MDEGLGARDLYPPGGSEGQGLRGGGGMVLWGGCATSAGSVCSTRAAQPQIQTDQVSQPPSQQGPDAHFLVAKSL